MSNEVDLDTEFEYCQIIAENNIKIWNHALGIIILARKCEGNANHPEAISWVQDRIKREIEFIFHARKYSVEDPCFEDFCSYVKNEFDENPSYESIVLFFDELKLLFNHLYEHIKSPKQQIIERQKLSKSLRYDVMSRDYFHCVLCGATGKDDKLVIDHIIPISKGGKTELENLRTLCQTCNSGKRDKLE